MKPPRTFFTGVVIGLLLAVGLFILGMPFVQQNVSFLFGFTACLVLGMILSLGVWWLWPADRSNPKEHVTMSGEGAVMRTSRFFNKRTFLFCMLILAGVWGCYGLLRVESWLRAQKQKQREALMYQMELLGSIRMSSVISLQDHVMDRIEQELKRNVSRILSTETIDQIATLSYGFKPYRFAGGDKVSDHKLSPERGQLLLMLIRMDLDTATLDSIFQKATFSGADLRGANLKGAYLRGVDLSLADLRESQLEGAGLRNADLSFSNLWAANLHLADLREAFVKRADLRWANLNEANLAGADLTEVNLVLARLRHANLRGVVLEWTDLTGAHLEEADLTASNMYTTILTRAQCSGTQFQHANLTSSTLIETNLTGANFVNAKMDYAKLTRAEMKGAIVGDADWLNLLSKWNVTGTSWVQEHYVLESSGDDFRIKVK